MNQEKCEELQNIFKIGFDKGLQKYLDKDDELHHALFIKRKVYPGYDGYEIHTGTTKDIKSARNLQGKTTTTIEKDKLKDLQTEVEILEAMIVYTENIAALSVFNVKILRQTLNRKHESKETMFG